jgi:ferredoxin
MKKIANILPECVACGYCMKICPLRAISVPKGIGAEIDESKCIGCGKCAKGCPAQVITIIERGRADVKAKAVV